MLKPSDNDCCEWAFHFRKHERRQCRDRILGKCSCPGLRRRTHLQIRGQTPGEHQNISYNDRVGTLRRYKEEQPRRSVPSSCTPLPCVERQRGVHLRLEWSVP